MSISERDTGVACLWKINAGHRTSVGRAYFRFFLSPSPFSAPLDNDGTTTGRVICGRWCDRMQDGRQYVPIALIVIVNSSHVARGVAGVYTPPQPTPMESIDRHERIPLNVPRSSMGLSPLPKYWRGRRFNWESTFTGILITGGYILLLPFPRPRCSSGNRLINTLSKSFGRKVEVWKSFVKNVELMIRGKRACENLALIFHPGKRVDNLYPLGPKA